MKNNKLATQSQLFNFQGKNFTVILINNEPHWVAKEICDYLELSNPSVSLKNLKEDTQKKLMTKEFCTKFNLGHFPNGLNLLTEAGVYKLVFKSRKPNAEDFTDWISEDVLPTIRKTGKYDSIEEKLKLIEDPKERELSLGLYSLQQALKVNPNDMLLIINCKQKENELTTYKQQKQLELVNNKLIEQEKKLDNMFIIGDRVQFANEINRVARATGRQQSEIYNLTYGKLKGMYGIDLNARSKNKQVEIQNKRIEQGKRAYALTTLKNKVNNLMIADELEIWNELGNSLNAVKNELMN
ncbi:Bro-N domain-containing protein [Clostridium botulinum]|uniref:BRO-N domain-containing protein n=1 Tax=Clostridium botulinum TaxID=1491 RepID=UPI001E3E3C8E|nr:BRO family protein [Clostridium botulinum]MCD3330995.1 hypothetical protein [Clostridium botulinum D/C]MCD3337002.1 hypothetical protein [Clostridium botulinum D/C]MCD3345822.1 hypothetical protein [Clostridium botulinum D/C]MCD3354611.1 hypothetical protein [Clostridium botulinum D/C]